MKGKRNIKSLTCYELKEVFMRIGSWISKKASSLTAKKKKKKLALFRNLGSRAQGLPSVEVSFVFWKLWEASG